jgi:hypothetical protein
MLEYWNDGLMGDLVLGNVEEEKWGNGLSTKSFLTGRLNTIINA